MLRKNHLLLGLLLLIALNMSAYSHEELLLKLENAAETEKAAILNELSRSHLNGNTDLAQDYAQKAGLLASELNQTDQLALSFKHRGIVAYFKGQNDLAFEFYAESLRLFEVVGNELEQSNIYNNMANIWFAKRDFDQTLSLHLKALAIREKLNETRLIIGSMINIGNVYLELNDHVQAHEYYLKALEINKLVLPEEINPMLLLSLGKTLIAMGESFEALEYFNMALDGAIKKEDYRTVFIVNNMLGNFYLQNGNHEKAIFHLNNALEVTRLTNATVQESAVLLNIGNVFDATGQHEKALGFYNEASRIFKSINDFSGVLRSYLNIGTMFDRLNQADSALRYYQKAVELSKQFSDNSYQAISYNFLGNQYRQMTNYTKAKPLLEKSLEIATESQNLSEIANASGFLAHLYFETGNYAKSEEMALLSLAYNKQQSYLRQIKENLLLLSNIYEQTGNYRQSLSYFKQYNAIKDSLFDQSRLEQITAIQEKLNFELKEKELQNKNLQIGQQQLELSQTRERFIYLALVALLLLLLMIGWLSWYRLRQSRAKLLLEQKQTETEHRLLRSQMNPHFMFNALNSIQLFISEKDSKQAEQYLSKFAHLMRYYLDSSFTSYVLMNDEIEGLKLNLELERLRMNEGFDFEIVVSDQIDPADTEIPPMLAQPFIENAIKHGFRTKSSPCKLSVTFELADANTMRCVVEDNGIGRKAASSIRRANNGHTSKGMEITLNRLKNIWKKDFRDDYLKIIDLTSADGKASGTRIVLLFPCLT